MKRKLAILNVWVQDVLPWATLCGLCLAWLMRLSH